MSTPMLTKLQEHREAESLVPSFGREASLTRKRMNSSPDVAHPQPCSVLIEAWPSHRVELPPALVYPECGQAMIFWETISSPFFSQLPDFSLVKDFEKAPSHRLHWAQQGLPKTSLDWSCFPGNDALCLSYSLAHIFLGTVTILCLLTHQTLTAKASSSYYNSFAFCPQLLFALHPSGQPAH